MYLFRLLFWIFNRKVTTSYGYDKQKDEKSRFSIAFHPYYRHTMPTMARKKQPMFVGHSIYVHEPMKIDSWFNEPYVHKRPLKNLLTS